MVRLYVRNWRCIEEVEVSLEPITVFIGRNSTGKSSLAYAPYFLAKVVEWKDANKVLLQLYGVQLDGVVRSDGMQRFYPLVVEVGSSRFEARSASDVSIPESSPWTSGYLLPSQRLGFIKISQFIPKLGREVMGKYPEARVTLAFASFIFEMVRGIPILPPLYFFLEDLMKLYLGKGFLKRRELGDMGALIEESIPFLNLIIYEYEDPFTKLRLPLDLSPDGFVDSALVRMFVENVPEKSLVVIEEPEIHKNPIQIVEFVRYIAEKAVERGLTLVMTTHSDLALQAIAKAVESKVIEARHTAIYYFERSRENPWTRIRRLEVYEDGTIEELPDVEKVVAALF